MAAPPPTHETRPSLWTRALAVFFPVLLGPLQVLLVGPYTLYRANSAEFSAPFSALIGLGLISLATITAVLTLVGICLRGRLFQSYLAMLFAFGLVVWLQGNLLRADYGLLDGQDLDFSRHAGRSPYELALWIGLPLLALLLAPRVAQIAPFFSQVLVLLQLAWVLLSAGIHPSKHSEEPQWRVPPAEIYQLSQKQNVIHFVFDAFQSDVFRELIEQEPDLAASLEGFTFFADHAGAFPTTAMSIPAMLSGETYRNEQPMIDATADLLARQSIFQTFSQHGFEIDMITILGRFMQGPITHRFLLPKPYVSYDLYRRFTAGYLLDVAWFRHAPHALKPWIYNHQQWRVQTWLTAEDRAFHAANGMAFLREFTAQLEVSREPPVVKHIHVGLPHFPAVLDRNCRFVGLLPHNRESFLGQAHCALELLREFLAKLRALKQYDQSLIVVTSDHGTALRPRGYRPAGDRADLAPIVSSAMALLLIKPPGAHGRLAISSAPTTITDLPATLFDVLGLSHNFPGEPALRLAPEAPRRRTYGYYRWQQENWQKPYFEVLQLFSLAGPILDEAAWHFDRALFSPELDLATARIDLGNREENHHLGIGWGSNEVEPDGTTFAWAMGRAATVFVSLPGPRPWRLTARCATLLENAPQTVEVWVDSRFAGQFQFAHHDNQLREYLVTLPPDPARPRISTLEFRFAQHLSLAEPENQRPLAVRCDDLALEPQ